MKLECLDLYNNIYRVVSRSQSLLHKMGVHRCKSGLLSIFHFLWEWKYKHYIFHFFLWNFSSCWMENMFSYVNLCCYYRWIGWINSFHHSYEIILNVFIFMKYETLKSCYTERPIRGKNIFFKMTYKNRKMVALVIHQIWPKYQFFGVSDFFDFFGEIANLKSIFCNLGFQNTKNHYYCILVAINSQNFRKFLYYRELFQNRQCVTSLFWELPNRHFLCFNNSFLIVTYSSFYFLNSNIIALQIIECKSRRRQ